MNESINELLNANDALHKKVERLKQVSRIYFEALKEIHKKCAGVHGSDPITALAYNAMEDAKRHGGPRG